ncbi:hypothetical protein VTH06DRAFT_7870 [Thermothelomyces fergusii]
MWWIESNPRKPTSPFGSSPPTGTGSFRSEPGTYYHHMPAASTYGLSDLSSAGRGPRGENKRKSNNKDEDNEDDKEDAAAARGFSSRVQKPTTKLTWAQVTYLLLKQALPSTLIAGAINFAVGYPMYASPRPAPPAGPALFLFRPPASLVADAALTTLVQTAVTWACLAVLVNGALSRGEVAPYAPPPPPSPSSSSSSSVREASLVFLLPWPLSWRGLREPRGAAARWFLMLDHYNAERGSRLLGWCGRLCCCCCCCSPASSVGRRARRAGRWVAFGLAGLGRAVMVALLGFLVMVGPTIGICAVVGTRYDGDWVFLGRWDGVVFHAVYGGVLAFILSPALALMWMLRAGWIVNRHAAAV